MDTGYLLLTVYFEDPFWVGVAERYCRGRLSAAKVTFGAEPSDQQVWQWVLQRWHTLRFSPAVEAAAPWRAVSPKRAQRQAARALVQRGASTKAQQALSAQRELGKQERQARQKERRQALAEEKFLLRRQKRLEKHRGR